MLHSAVFELQRKPAEPSPRLRYVFEYNKSFCYLLLYDIVHLKGLWLSNEW